MRPKERRETGQSDLFRARLDQIVDRHHPVVKLARAIDWGFLEEQFGAVYTDEPGRPPLPTRLMAGLAILKHMHDLSDEVLCARWVENPYYQLFCGEEFHSISSALTTDTCAQPMTNIPIWVCGCNTIWDRTGAESWTSSLKTSAPFVLEERSRWRLGESHAR